MKLDEDYPKLEAQEDEKHKLGKKPKRARNYSNNINWIKLLPFCRNNPDIHLRKNPTSWAACCLLVLATTLHLSSPNPSTLLMIITTVSEIRYTFTNCQMNYKNNETILHIIQRNVGTISISYFVCSMTLQWYFSSWLLYVQHWNHQS